MTTRFTLNVTSDEMGANGSGMSQNATVSSDNPQDLLSALTQLAGVNRASNSYGMQAYGQEAEQGEEHECNECGYMESKCQCEDEVAEEFANSATEPKGGAQVYSAAGGVGDIAFAGEPARARTRYTPANSGDNPLVNENMLGDLGASLMREWQETKLQGVSDEFDTKAAMKAIAEGKTEYRHGSKQFAIRTDNNIIKVFPILENHTLLTMPLLALEASSIVNTQTEGNFTEGSRIADGTMAHGIFASNAREAQDAMTQLAELLQNPLSAAEAQDLLGDLVFDDQLFEAISDAEDQDPDMDLRQDSKFMGRLEELKSWAQKELEGMSEGSFNDDGSYNTSDDEANEFDEKQPTEGVTEDYDSVEAVASAITNRIMRQHVDLLSKYGPVKVMAAIDDVAEYAGKKPLDEIGGSDVSGWVKQVADGLESGHFNHVDEGVAEDSHEEQVARLAAYNEKMAGKNPPIDLGLREVGNWAKVGHYGDPIKTAWFNIAKYGIRNNKFNDSVDRAMSAIGDFPDKYDLSIPEIDTLYSAYETVYDQWKQLQGQQGVAEGLQEGRNVIATGTPDDIKIQTNKLGMGEYSRESTGSGGEAIFVFNDPGYSNYYIYQGQDGTQTLYQTNTESDQQGVAEGTFDGQELAKILKNFNELMNDVSDKRGAYGNPDHNKIMAALDNRDIDTALDIVWDAYSTKDGGEVQDMDDYLKDLEQEFKFLVYSDPTQRVREGAHTSTIAAMADSAYQPKVGDKIRTRKGGQVPGTVEKVGDQDGIDYCWFRHPEGKMYKTPCSNVMREDMDEAMEPWMGKDTNRPAIDRKKEHENGKPAHTNVGDRFRNPGSNNPAFQRKKYVPEPKKENIEMNEELAEIMALAGMHEAKVDEQDVDENAYNQAAAAASRSGAKEFEFPKGSGKMHPAKMDKDTAHQIGEAQSPAQKAAFAAMIAKKSGDKPKAKDDDKKSDDNKKPDDDGDGIPNWVKGESANMDEDFTDMLALAGLSEKKDPEDEAKMDEASHQAATTMKHVKNPTQGEKDAAKKIKPGIAGVRDRFDMLASAEKDGRLKNESTIAEDEELAYVKHLLNKWL